MKSDQWLLKLFLRDRHYRFLKPPGNGNRARRRMRLLVPDTRPNIIHAEAVQRLVNYAFSLLQELLLVTPLETALAQHRIVSASEFMLMNPIHPPQLPDILAFKHRYTRNYIYITRSSQTLSIPKRNQPFHNGTLDCQPQLIHL